MALKFFLANLGPESLLDKVYSYFWRVSTGAPFPVSLIISSFHFNPGGWHFLRNISGWHYRRMNTHPPFPVLTDGLFSVKMTFV